MDKYQKLLATLLPTVVVLLCILSLGSSSSCSLFSKRPDPDLQIYLCDPSKGEQLVKLVGWEDAWQTVDGCSVTKPTETSIVMKIFYLHWLENFGDRTGRVEATLHKLMVLWGRDLKTTSGYRMDGTYGRDIKARGIAHTKSIIWVRRPLSSKVCETSLVHELVHIAIWSKKGTHGDPDHLGGKYLGWTVDHSAFIQNVNQELCRLGI